jgi:chromosome segregation ATPase
MDNYNKKQEEEEEDHSRISLNNEMTSTQQRSDELNSDKLHEQCVSDSQVMRSSDSQLMRSSDCRQVMTGSSPQSTLSTLTSHHYITTGNLESNEINTDDVKSELASLREQLHRTQIDCKYSQTEAEQLRGRVRVLQEELEYTRLRVSGGCSNSSSENTDDDDDKQGKNTMQQEIHKELARNRAEFSVLKEECAQLRQRIHDIETEMKMSRLENYQLKEEYNCLQASYKELEQLKSQLQSKESTWLSNITDAQKEANTYKQELDRLCQELRQLEFVCTQREQDIEQLRETLAKKEQPNKEEQSKEYQNKEERSKEEQNKEEQTTRGDVTELSDEERETTDEEDEYASLALQCQTISTVSMIPLLMLLLGFILAFLPFLSTITATFHPPTTTTQDNNSS